MKTYQPKGKVTRSWHLLDANGQILGRLSSQAAIFLMGKQKADYSANIDSGDEVVILNVEKIQVTGKKAQDKTYKSHSGYPGGFKERSFEKYLKEQPEKILYKAVSGMLPDNRLKKKRLGRLHLIVGNVNTFEAKFAKVEAK